MVSFPRTAKLLLAFHSIFSLGRSQNATLPTRFGYVLFPGFEVLDVFGPLEALNLLSLQHTINLTLIADTLSPVTNLGISLTSNPLNSTFHEFVLPTHTFETAPPLDVLIVPGGVGTRAPVPLLNSTIDFVRDRYPSLQYLITVCTGAGIAARAGVLDGKYATTNKRAWAQTTALGPNVNWVTQARWVQDGNTWTSSGVSAGIDVTIAWISDVYGNEAAEGIANAMEYRRQLNSTDDPFAALYNLTDAANSTHPGNSTGTVKQLNLW